MPKVLRLAAPAALALACNQPPGAPSGVTLSPDAPTTVDEITVSFEAPTDPNGGDSVTPRIQWMRDGERVAELDNQETVRAGHTKKGEEWTVTVSGFDGSEVGPTASASVTVVNSPPEASVTFSPAEPKTDDRIRTTATRRDADNEAVELRYEWVRDGSVTTHTGTDLTAAETEKGQTWEVRVYPSDADGEADPAVGSFVIGNTEPSVEQARIAPAAPTRADTLECQGVGWDDLDGDAPGYDVVWLVNGVETSPDATLPLADIPRGTRVGCILTPNDGDDVGDPVRSGDVTVQNSPPVAGSVSIGPADPTKDDDVTATIEGGTDPDGDPITYTYNWVVAGESVGAAATLPSSRFRKGDSIYLELTPNDGIADGEAIRSNIVEGGNNPPVLARATFDPSTVYTDTLITLDAIANDHDDDEVTLTVAWYVNGSVLSVTDPELDGDTWFDRDDEIYAIVTPDDGDDVGSPVTTSTFTVLNSPPTVPGVTMDPEDPEVGDDIHCDMTTVSTDADGDTLTYTFRWLVNGSAVAGTTTTYTNDTLPASAWGDDDDLICEITVSDGYDPVTTEFPVRVVEEWGFTDTTSDDVATDSLYDFFSGLGTVDSTDYIMVEIDGGSSTTLDGAWCSERADWYVSNYITYASGSTTLSSGSWNKWSRAIGGSWSAATTTSRSNYFGSGCDTNAYSWCSEWGIGGKSLGIMPGNKTSNGESYTSGWSNGRSYEVKVVVGPRRKDVCGF